MIHHVDKLYILSFYLLLSLFFKIRFEDLIIFKSLTGLLILFFFPKYIFFHNLGLFDILNFSKDLGSDLDLQE